MNEENPRVTVPPGQTVSIEYRKHWPRGMRWFMSYKVLVNDEFDGAATVINRSRWPLILTARDHGFRYRIVKP
jgi:hypothetical protein